MAERITCILSCVVTLALLSTGMMLLLKTGYNFTLLLAALWLLLCYCKSGIVINQMKNNGSEAWIGNWREFFPPFRSLRVIRRRIRANHKEQSRHRYEGCPVLSRHLRDRHVKSRHQNTVRSCKQDRRRLVRARICPLGRHGSGNAAGAISLTYSSGDAVGAFDIVAFSLGYEMTYTNVLNMLDLAGIPLRSSERKDLTPLVIAGGVCAYNPEPMADFIDLFIIGEGEEVNSEVINAYREAKKIGLGKDAFLKEAARIKGVYVPGLYTIEYQPDGKIAAITPRDGAPMPVMKRIADFEKSYFPAETVVPSTEIVHDRVVLSSSADVCAPAVSAKPDTPITVRARSKDRLTEYGINALENSGYEEITLSSLSTSDYRELFGLCDGLLDWCEPRNISLSLPSLRADNFSMELMKKVQKVRNRLTFAPEAGSQRLRDAINKNVTQEDLLETCRIALRAAGTASSSISCWGCRRKRTRMFWKLHSHRKGSAHLEAICKTGRGVRITVSTSCFIPKPLTPFNGRQITPEEYRRR